jgi:tetratricopeptide (TPR) repeat protein
MAGPYKDRNRSEGSRQEAVDVEQILVNNAPRVLCLAGESGAGKTSLANEIVVRVRDRFDATLAVYLPPQGLLRSVDDFALSSLSSQLLETATRGLTQAAMMDELFEAVGSRTVLCTIDNAESLDLSWLRNFVRRWLRTQGRSLLVLTTTLDPLPDVSLDSENGYVTFDLGGLAPADWQLILALLGEDLQARFPTSMLMAVSQRVRSLPQLLLYLRWLQPATADELWELAEQLSRNVEIADLVRHVIAQSTGPMVPFLALGRIRATSFEEGLLAALWDRLGGGSVQGYVRTRDGLLDLGVLSRALDAPTNFYINPAVHVHMEKYIARELAPEQLAQIEYHIGEYYRTQFLERPSAESADALNAFLYHSARARNIEEAARFVVAGGQLERLGRSGQSLGVRRAMQTASNELGQVLDQEPKGSGGSAGVAVLLGAINVELAHVLSDLSDYEEALSALAEAESTASTLEPGAEEARFKEVIAFRRGICLGDSGRLREAAAEYLTLVRRAIESETLGRVPVRSLGYAAIVLSYLQEPVAASLGALSVRLADRLGHPDLSAQNCCSYAQVLAYSGSVDQATTFIGRARTIVDPTTRGTADRRELGRVLIAEATVQLARGDVEAANLVIREAISLNQEIGERRRIARGEKLAGVAAFRSGRLLEAKQILTRSLDGLVRVGDVLDATLCCLNLAYLDGIRSSRDAIQDADNGARGRAWAEVLRDSAARPGFDIKATAEFWSSCYAPRILGAREIEPTAVAGGAVAVQRPPNDEAALRRADAG